MSISNPHDPFFSIVIPTYNRVKQLNIALNSIVKQNFSNFEIIVVDDGSRDQTQEIISQMALVDSRIRYFFKENEERSIARNFGIMKARGQYIGFLDSDDIVYPNHLKVGYTLLRDNNFPEVGHLGYEFIDTSGKSILVRNTFDSSFKDKLIHENILHGNAIFIRKDIAREVNFISSKEAIISEDWCLWLKLASRFDFYFDNTVTSAVVEHPGRSLLNINSDKLIASTNVIIEHLKMDLPFLKTFRGKTSRHFANHYTLVTLVLALSKKRRVDTLKFLAKAICYDPTVIFSRRFLASLKYLFLETLNL